MAKRQILGFIGVLFLALFSSIFVSAQTTYYSRQTGDWNVNTTWTLSSTHGAATPAAGPPVAGDIVFIGGSDVVTVPNAAVAAAAAQVTVSDDGTTCSLVIGNGVNTNNATLNVTTSVTINNGGTITVGGTNSTAGRTGNLLGGATLTLNGNGALIIGNTSDEISTVSVSSITQNGTSTITVGANTNASHTLTASGAVAIGATAIFRSGGNNGGTHTVNFQSTLANSGTITLDDDDGVLDNDAVTFTVASTTNNTGTITFGSDVGVKTFAGAVTNTGTFDVTGTTSTGNLVFRGGVSSNGGTFTAGGATFNDVVSNTQTIGGTAAMSFANTVTLTDGGAPSLVVTNSNTNTVTLSNAAVGTLTGTAGVTWRQGAGSTLSYAGSTITGITLDASTNSNTVNYSGAGQTIADVPYVNLITSGSGTKTWTMTANRAVSGALTVGNGTTLSVGGAFDFTVTGTTTIGSGTSGIFNITGTGVKTFTGAVTINAGGTWNHSTANPATSFGGGITMNGTTFNNGTGAASFSTSQSLLGSSAMTFGGSVIPAASTTLTNSNSATVTINNVTLTGNFTQGSNTPSLTVTNANPFTGAGTLDAGTNNNTVTYTGANPPIKATTYRNLTVNGSGSATVGGTTTVSGTMTVNSTVTNNSILTVTTALSGTNSLIQGAGSTLNIGGTSGITTLDASSNVNTVNYTGAAQTVKAVAYRTLGLSGSGAKTMTGVTTINGDFSIGGTASATAAAALTISGNITLGSGTSFTAGAFTHNIAGNWTNDGATFTNTGSTINLNGASQNIGGTSSTTFNNLVLAGSSTKTFNAATFSAGDLSISAGVVANLGSFTTHTAYTLTLAGSMQIPGIWGSTASGAPNVNDTFFASTLGRLTVAFRPSITYYSRQTGNWDATTTWSTVTYANATNTGTYPVAGDIVNIGGGNFTITVNVNSACTSLSYQGGANFNTSVSLNAGITLNVSGTITLASGGWNGFLTFYNNTLAVGGGILNAGNIDFADGGTLGTHTFSISTGTATVTNDVTGGLNNLQTTINITSTGTLNLGGTFLNSTTTDFNAAAGSTVNYSGSAQTIGDFTYHHLTLSGGDTKTFPTTIDINGNLTIGAGTTLVAGAFDHTVGGNWVNNGIFTHSGSTITFDGAAQNIGGSSTTSFNNVSLNGSGTKTFGAASFSAGYFSVATGVVVNLGGFTNHTANSLILGGTGQNAGVWGGTGSGAANINATYFGATPGRLTTGVVGPSIYYTRATGDWDSNATWSTVGFGGAAATSFPTAGSIVNVGGGNFTVTVDANAACAYLNYQADAGNSPVVSLNTGITLTVSATVDIPGTSFLSGDVNTLAVGAGILNAGSIAFTDGGFLGGHELTISTGTVTVTGNVTANTGTLSLPQLTFTGAGTLNVTGTFLDSGFPVFTASTGTVNYSGATQTITNFAYNNLTTSGSGTKTLTDATDINGILTIGAGTTLVAGGFTHTIGGNWVNNGTFTNTGSTITLDGTAQSIGGSNSTTFNNLTLAGSSTKTFSRVTTINATIAINTGVIANLGAGFTHTARTLSLNNQGQIPGTWGGTGSGATNINTTFFAANTGILNTTNRIYFANVNNGNWNAPGSWSTVTYAGGTNAGTFPGSGDIASIGGDFNINVNVNSSCAFITFQQAATTNTLTINNGITLDVSGSITIPRTTNGADNNTLAVGAGNLNAGSLLFTNGGGAGTRHRMTISTGIVSISGDVTESGSTGSATITFTGAGQLRLGGAFLNSNNGTLTEGTGTVVYNGSVAQTIGDFTYYNLTLNNSSGTIPQLTLADNTTVTNTLTMTSGIVNLNSAELTLGASGAASTLTRTPSVTTNWMYGGTFTRFWPASTAITSSSGNYYGLFPVGIGSASSYRPVEINSTSNPTGTGSFSVTHTGATSVTNLSPVFNDLGTNIVRKHNARFVTATTATGGLYNIDVTMTGLPVTGSLADLRLAVNNGATTVTTVGNHAAATGIVSNPMVSRTGVALANLVGDFRITTSNLSITPLPIELFLFKGEVINNVVQLTWETASELNNDFFTVERSSGGEIFSAIGEVKGKGTTNQSHVYTLNDVDPLTGTSYYRLKQTDFDGTFTYSKVIPITYEGSVFPVMHLYPNPTTENRINIEIKGIKNIKFIPIRVYDNLGVEWARKEIAVDENTGIASDVLHFEKALPKGVYVVKAGPNQIMAVKFVIYEK